MDKPVFLVWIFLLSITCLNGNCQTFGTSMPNDPVILTRENLATATQYIKAKASLDSLISPILLKMLKTKSIDSATLASCDKIITTKKEVIVAHIYNITFSDVRFFYPSDDQLNELKRSNISQILYSDGRIDVFVPLENRSIKQEHLVDTSRIIIKNQKDWMKVIATEDIAIVSGLIAKGSLKVRFEASNGNADQDYLVRNATNRLKKKAAHLQTPYILIESKFFQNSFGDLPSVEIIATAYDYE